jgi:GntR family transcriptional regulator
MAIQTAHIPVLLAPGLAREDFRRASLYDLLEKKYGIVPARAREVHSAVMLAAEDARLLRLGEGALGLAARRITYTADGRPFELVHSVARADRYQIVLDLTC